MATVDIESQRDEHSNLTLSSRYEQRHSRVRSFSATDNGILDDNGGAQINKMAGEILLLLRIIGKHGVRHLAIAPLQLFNLRETLGVGVSFLVEEADIPISDSLSHLRYRDLNFGGLDGKSFIDHTKTAWSPDSRVAYKTLRESNRRSRSLDAIISELQVLCHPPLKDNVVRLAGVAWIHDSNSDHEEPMEWPTIVTEKAPLGSIRQFFRSSFEKGEQITLRAKLEMCVQVLRCIENLHACGVVHCDIKCENVLVFESAGSRSDFWRVKLSDFGNSLVDIDYYDPADIIRKEPMGTPRYISPELDTSTHRQAQTIKKIDIWAWGLLLWEVIIDGNRYYDTNEDVNGGGDGTELRDQAHKACSEFIDISHFHERGDLANVISFALRAALDPDPSGRPSATELLQKLGPSIGDHHNIVFQGQKIEREDDLAPFDLCDHYYGLIGFPTAPQQVFKALSEIVRSSNGEASLESSFQLGLCVATGFGTELDYDEALHRIQQAASSGEQRARTMTKRLHEALRPTLQPPENDRIGSWLVDAAKRGSYTALVDLKRYFPRMLETVSNHSHFMPQNIWREDLLSIYQLLSGDHDILQTRLKKIEVTKIGPSGETILHWCVFLPCEVGPRITELLLARGVPLSSATTKACLISGTNERKFLENTMPSDTTSLDWAIIEDNIELVRILLSKFKEADSVRPYGLSSFTPLTCAARYQSYKCLSYLCVSENITEFDGFGTSPAFHALRPDILLRMMHYSPDYSAEATYSHGGFLSEVSGYEEPNDTDDREIPPYVQKEIRIMNLIISSDSSIKVHKDNHFNHFHLTAALVHKSLLGFLLENANLSSKEYMEEFAIDGKTPIACIIAQGNEQAFRMFLVAGANPKITTMEEKFHSLHLCALYRRENLVEVFAATLLDQDPDCVNYPGKLFTPLHLAAISGNKKMIDLLLSRGAFIYSLTGPHPRPYYGYTPLGLAILFRSVVGVRELSKHHRELNTTLVAGIWHYTIFLPITMMPFPITRHIMATTLLLAPGSETRKDVVDLSSIPFRYMSSEYPGSCELPTSDVSREILEILQEGAGCDGLIRFCKRSYLEARHIDLPTSSDWFDVTIFVVIFGKGITFIIRLLSRLLSQYHELEPGTRWAVRMGNLEALKVILPIEPTEARPEGNFSPNLRSLLELAFQQLYIAGPHVASENDRLEVFEYLQELQKTTFERERRSRKLTDSNGHRWIRFRWCMSYLWMIYYNCYGTLEQKQFQKYNTWLLDDRPTQHPMIFEFQSFVRPRVSLYILLYGILWRILGPFLHHLVILASDPITQFSFANALWVTFVVLAVNFTPLWAVFFRISSIWYHSIFKTFSGFSYRHSLFQLLVIGINLGCSVIAANSLDVSNRRLVRFHPRWSSKASSDLSWDGLMLSPAKQSTLASFQNECSLLVAYLAIVSIISNILVFHLLLLKFMRIPFSGWRPEKVSRNKPGFEFGNWLVRQ